jgi:hypothetical protein
VQADGQRRQQAHALELGAVLVGRQQREHVRVGLRQQRAGFPHAQQHSSSSSSSKRRG